MDDTLDRATRALAALQLDEAASLYQSLIDQDDENYEAWIGFAKTLTKQRKTDEAFAAANKCIALDPERWDGYASLGTLSFLIDENDQAIEELKRAVSLNASEPEPLLTLSQVYAEKEEFELAEDSLREGQSLVDQMEEGTEKRAMQAFALHVKTYLLLSRGENDAAFETAQEIIAYKDANPHAACLAYSTLGILSWRDKDMDAAQEYLEQAHELNPYFSRSAATLGQLYYMRQQYDRAVEVLGDAVALNPRTDGAIHYAYGSALAKARRRQEAHEQFKVAIEQGLKGLPKWVARWQLIWLGTVGRTVIIMLGLALVAAWLIWGQPDMSTLTLFGAFAVFLLLRRLFGKKRTKQ